MGLIRGNSAPARSSAPLPGRSKNHAATSPKIFSTSILGFLFDIGSSYAYTNGFVRDSFAL